MQYSGRLLEAALFNLSPTSHNANKDCKDISRLFFVRVFQITSMARAEFLALARVTNANAISVSCYDGLRMELYFHLE